MLQISVSMEVTQESNPSHQVTVVWEEVKVIQEEILVVFGLAVLMLQVPMVLTPCHTVNSHLGGGTFAGCGRHCSCSCFLSCEFKL